ncbi:MAG: hypothetical protein AB7K68_07760 [Bacteriovoracia bacterium]
MNSLLVLVILLSPLVSSGANFQKEIDKSFPEHVLLKKGEFSSDCTQKDPGLIAGDFDGDKRSDFAAIIRAKEKKRYEAGVNSYHYYDGKLVVCYSQKKSGYKCSSISNSMVTIPENSCLEVIKPGEAGCIQDDGTKKSKDIKFDSVGLIFPERAASQYIRQPDGSFQNCVIGD